MARTIQVLPLLLVALAGIGAHDGELPEDRRLIRGQETPDVHEDDVSVCVSRH